MLYIVITLTKNRTYGPKASCNFTWFFPQNYINEHCCSNVVHHAKPKSQKLKLIIYAAKFIINKEIKISNSQ